MANVIRQPCDEGVILSKEARSPCTPNAAPWVLTATILGSSMAFIDETGVTVALPTIQSALGATASQTAGLLAVAVLGVIMFVSFGSSLDHRVATLELPPEARQQLEEEKVKLGAAEAPEGMDAATSVKVELAIDEAFVSGYRVVMLVAAGVALASAISAGLLVEGKKPKVITGEASMEERVAPRHP